jgi:hypothetical protein
MCFLPVFYVFLFFLILPVFQSRSRKFNSYDKRLDGKIDSLKQLFKMMVNARNNAFRNNPVKFMRGGIDLQ